MKTVLCLLALAACAAAQNVYLPPAKGPLPALGAVARGGARVGGSFGGGNGGSGGGRPLAILRQTNENNGDGTYSWSYETENGIDAQERGAEGPQSAQGSFSYTGPDNVRYSVQYTADENGFLAYGDHLPTPPPVPAEIQAAIEQNLADEARGIVDDGQYRPDPPARGASGGYPSTGAAIRGSVGNGGYRY